MKKKFALILTITIAFSLLLTSYHPSNAVQYYGHDGSVDEYLTKVVVKPYSNKNGLWTYVVKVCATDHTLGIAAIILKSDMEQNVLGVNKNLKKGDCTRFGSVMKAKDGKTLGADMIEKHEALQKYQELLNGLPHMTKSAKKNAYQEINLYRNLLGGLV